jgi:DNA-directed RNA polymerase alpha subunit
MAMGETDLGNAIRRVESSELREIVISLVGFSRD